MACPNVFITDYNVTAGNFAFDISIIPNLSFSADDKSPLIMIRYPLADYAKSSMYAGAYPYAGTYLYAYRTHDGVCLFSASIRRIESDSEPLVTI